MLTKTDLTMLAAAGANLSAEEVVPTQTGVMAAVLSVAESPSARLVDAAVVALLWLARQDMLQAQDFAQCDVPTKRFLGYLTERQAMLEDDAEMMARLRAFASRLDVEVAHAAGEPVWLLETFSPRTRARLLREASHLNKKWHVYG